MQSAIVASQVFQHLPFCGNVSCNCWNSTRTDKILFNSWPGFSRTKEILNKCCLEREPKLFQFYMFMKIGFDAIILIYKKNLTSPAENRTQGPGIYVSVLWPLSYWHTAMTARNFCLRSEHRHVDSETLGSISSWGNNIFRICKYDRIKSSLHEYVKFEYLRFSLKTTSIQYFCCPWKPWSAVE